MDRSAIAPRAPDARLTIREYRASDATAIRACVAELQEAERHIDGRLRPGAEMARGYFQGMRRQCRRHAGTILVAECASEIAGFATVLSRVPFDELDEPPGAYAQITDIVVREPFRRQGIGMALLREAERHVRMSGAGELRVSVLSANRAARRLYMRARFAPYLETLAKRFKDPKIRRRTARRQGVRIVDPTT
jgi:ribosomal protein S18 acetylase RimI-like enzyme